MHRFAAVALFTLLAAAPAGAPRAQTIADCFADRVVALLTGTVSSPPATNTWQPGIILGPPGNATPTTGSLAVMSLGHGGRITLEFTDNEIVDGPGADFIVFENPFFCTAVPATAADPYSVFAEPGIVEASDDGVSFRMFPYDAAALSEVISICTDKTLLPRLAGLIGITPSFTGDYLVPDDPLVFDPASPGGVSGHGGDAFDLAAVGLARARFVRITDPADADSDGDGAPDGEEAASCRNPASTVAGPFFVPGLDLEVAEPSPTVVRWNFLGTGTTYDVIRGSASALHATGGLVDLGLVACIENDSTDLTTRGLADAAVPVPGAALFYLVRQSSPGSGLGYGFSSAHDARRPASGDCL